jgi:enoyl-CoA hydratase/carnithine racemase
MSKNSDTIDGIPALTFAGSTATIAFRRPREHNRIDPGDVAVIRSHLADILGRDGIRALVFTGAGDKTFCSGYTLQAIIEKLDRTFEDLLDEVEHFPLPTICALNGSVYGGATDLALCCDFRIGLRGTRMFMPAAKFGMHFYPGGLRRYVTNLGLAEAKRLFLTSQAIDAETMLRIGFLTELVEREELHAKVGEYLDAIGACEPAVLGSMKRQLNAIAAGNMEAAVARADYEKSMRSGAIRERMAELSRHG